MKLKDLEPVREHESEEENEEKLQESATKRMIRNGKIHAMVQREIENAMRFENEKEEAENELKKQQKILNEKSI